MSKTRIFQLLSYLIVGALISGCAAQKPPPTKKRLPLKIKSIPARAAEPLRREVVMVALSTLGIKYKWGGNTPEEGMDCSGLVLYAYEGIAVADLPRTSKELAQMGASVAQSKLKPGDLVFFNTIGRRPNSHVGIYMGNGKFINAPATGKRIRIDSLDDRYYAQRFNGARTLFN